ncbi:MAG: hypothetical protein R6U37_00775 [Dehalococcoidia bacterium]
MKIRGKVIAVLLLVGLLAAMVGGCSGSSGPPGPEEVAKDYIESGGVEELEDFMAKAMFGIPGVLEVTQVKTELVSETADTAVVEAECKMGVEDEAVRGSKVEMRLELEKHGEEWEVIEVEII